jgi:hypothetical protein
LASTYDEVVTAAKWVYERMLSHTGSPAKCTVRSLQTVLPPPLQCTREKNKSYLGNFYLQFENIRLAAIAGDSNLFQVGYYRNEQLVADRAEANQGKQNFIAWAVA